MKRSCATHGCGALVPAGTARCPVHARAKDKARGTTTERGYGSTHVALRAAYQARMDKGQRYSCWRCGRPIDPKSWHLGHCDSDRGKYHGPECTPCNTATSGRAGRCPHPIHN